MSENDHSSPSISEVTEGGDAQGGEGGETAAPLVPNKLEALEIEDVPSVPPVISPSRSADEGDDEFDDDLKGLLPTPRATKEDRKSSWWGPPAERVGTMTIFLPSLYYATGWGIRGPHWFGPPCILLIIGSATAYLIHTSLPQRPYTALTCAGFFVLCTYHLLNTAYRDPGLIRVKISDEEAGRDYCYCDVCNNWQPPGGVHCPECQVCVAGFDHHCVWMGTAIGRNNFRQFVRFNLSWLAYLMYAILWVKILAPILFPGHHGGQSIDENGDFF